MCTLSARIVLAFLAATFTLSATDVAAQDLSPVQTVKRKSPAKAFAMSAVLPGLGHRYVNGSWSGAATWYTIADVSSIAGYALSDWQHGRHVENYRGLATSRAGADLTGKDRTFLLNLAAYSSSDEFIEVVLRNRAWNQLDYIEDATFEWQWASEEDRLDYRSERNSAETASRRRSLLAAVMVGNRLLSGFTSALAARRTSGRAIVELTSYRDNKTRIGARLVLGLSR